MSQPCKTWGLNRRHQPAIINKTVHLISSQILFDTPVSVLRNHCSIK